MPPRSIKFLSAYAFTGLGFVTLAGRRIGPRQGADFRLGKGWRLIGYGKKELKRENED